MKKFISAAGVAGVLLASAVVTAPAAQAAEGQAYCSAQRVCLADNYFFYGERQFGWNTSYVGDSANDRASSLSVGAAPDPRLPYVQFFRDLNRGGPSLEFRAGGADNDLRRYGLGTNRNWDDEISSVYG